MAQVLLSGGVDSTVCTALLHRALSREQVLAVHIDNGFMRKRESQSVEEALKKLGIQVKGRQARGASRRRLRSGPATGQDIQVTWPGHVSLSGNMWGGPRSLGAGVSRIWLSGAQDSKCLCSTEPQPTPGN